MAAKRVLFLSYNGALEPIFQSQGLPYLRGLAKRGFGIILLTFEKKEDIRRLGKEKLEDLQKRLREEKIVWHYLSYHKRPPLLSTLFDLLMGLIQALHLAKKYSVDLIHARGSIPSGFGWTVAKLLRKPFLFDMRGFLAEEYADAGIWKKGSLAYRIVGWFEKMFLRSANGIVVLTRRASDHLRRERLCPDRVPITVIPCCVDLRRFERVSEEAHPISHQEFVLTYVGSVGTWYLLEPMLDFYRVLKVRIPHASFQIWTQTRDKQLQEKLRRYLDNGLVFREIEYGKIPGVLTSAKAGISFIKPVFSKMASSPVKIGEYLAAGLPVVLNPNVGDTEELIRENRVGVVVDRFEQDAYQSAVEELMELLKEGETLSKRCRRVASLHLSLEEGVKRYREIYEALLEGTS